jgi:hypothetical protein
MVLVAALGAGGVVVLGAAPAYACTCAGGALAPRLADADAAFVGTAVAAPDESVPSDRADGLVTWEFAVSDVYKGQLQARIPVLTPLPGGACGLDTVDVGDEVGMLLQRDDADASLWTSNLCALVEPAELRASGEPHGPISATTPEVVPDDNDPKWGLLAGAIVVLLAAAGTAWFRRDRRSRETAA